MEDRNVRRQVTFTIDGEPVAKERPRFGGGKGQPRTPDKTRAFETSVGLMAMVAMRGIDVMTGDVACRLTFWVKRDNKDIDNMAKAVLDGLNKVAWHDDSQVKVLIARILKDVTAPRIEVTVTEYAA